MFFLKNTPGWSGVILNIAAYPYYISRVVLSQFARVGGFEVYGIFVFS